MNPQQEEALKYFNKVAKEWSEKSEKTTDKKVGVIQQRNDYVLKVLERRNYKGVYLDVGCGSGDLVIDAAAAGMNSKGVDFAENMIEEAKAKAKKKGLQAEFVCDSALTFPFNPDQFDVISANGFIEYISLDELKKFVKLAAGSLKKGGELVLGSRNRLFNLFSMNEFTVNEAKAGTANVLFSEAVQLAAVKTPADIAKIKTIPLEENFNSTPITTGIEVSQRLQYTPAQLAGMMAECGLTISQVYPVHIHVAPPAFKVGHNKDHILMAAWMQNFAEESLPLLLQASTFMIAGKK